MRALRSSGGQRAAAADDHERRVVERGLDVVGVDPGRAMKMRISSSVSMTSIGGSQLGSRFSVSGCRLRKLLMQCARRGRASRSRQTASS